MSKILQKLEQDLTKTVVMDDSVMANIRLYKWLNFCFLLPRPQKILNLPHKPDLQHPLKKMHLGLRANPCSEFVVANTLAKWKKLEPNEINFSQGFSQKVVSTSRFFFI